MPLPHPTLRLHQNFHHRRALDTSTAMLGQGYQRLYWHFPLELAARRLQSRYRRPLQELRREAVAHDADASRLRNQLNVFAPVDNQSATIGSLGPGTGDYRRVQLRPQSLG